MAEIGTTGWPADRAEGARNQEGIPPGWTSWFFELNISSDKKIPLILPFSRSGYLWDTPDARVAEHIALVVARNGEFGNDRSHIPGLEPVQGIGWDGILFPGMETDLVKDNIEGFAPRGRLALDYGRGFSGHI